MINWKVWNVLNLRHHWKSWEGLQYQLKSSNWLLPIQPKVRTICICAPWASLVPQTVKRLPAMWETQVPSLGWEDTLEKEMATHSSILARRIPCTEEPGGLQPMALQSVWHHWATNTFTFKGVAMGNIEGLVFALWEEVRLKRTDTFATVGLILPTYLFLLSF